ncbi:MAG: hypothetical protein QOH81_371 [Sphingomonadales bacterium]|jgi:hypothetical protein|nr:hypothetical protein [Sphingomonadales bacterium]
MTFRIAEFCLGIALAAVTLRDVFDTVVVPGASDASLRIARRLVRLLLPLWKLMRRSGRGLSTTFAPVILVSSFVSWMLLLDIAFGLMAHGLGAWFDPPLTSFPQAMFVVGSGLVTVGSAATEATGGARWIILGAGFCGLAVMTMAVTYLLEVQSSIARRDSGILKLKTSAGEPPSALGLLEKYAAIGNQAELPHVLRDGRDWCATVRQSHGAHPSLIYFRSSGTGAGWPGALGALLDLALVVELLLDMPDLRGLAVLLREDGAQMAAELGALIELQPRPEAVREEELGEMRTRLAAAGYRLQDGPDHSRFDGCHDAYGGWVNALADHLGRPPAPLIPERG